MNRMPVVAVIGAGDAPAAVCKLAFAVGSEIARRGAVLLNGGRTGVMESAAAGARNSKKESMMRPIKMTRRKRELGELAANRAVVQRTIVRAERIFVTVDK